MNNPAYAKTTSSNPAKSGGGTLLGIFIGLVLGILLALGVALFLNKTALPFQDKYEGANKPTNGNGQTPLALPGKPGGTVPEKQHLDFYGILEGKSTTANPPVAGTNPRPSTAATPPAVAEPLATELLYLQLGAFQKAADAENLKAKLALTGFDAAVQEVDIPNKGTMRRVRVGPFANAAEMNAARERLAQAGIAGTVIKQKP